MGFSWDRYSIFQGSCWIWDHSDGWSTYAGQPMWLGVPFSPGIARGDRWASWMAHPCVIAFAWILASLEEWKEVFQVTTQHLFWTTGGRCHTCTVATIIVKDWGQVPLISRPKAGPAVSPAMAPAATAGVTVTSLSHLTPGPGLVNARGRVHVVSGVSEGYPIQKIKIADGDYLNTLCPVMNQNLH